MMENSLDKNVMILARIMHLSNRSEKAVTLLSFFERMVKREKNLPTNTNYSTTLQLTHVLCHSRSTWIQSHPETLRNFVQVLVTLVHKHPSYRMIVLSCILQQALVPCDDITCYWKIDRLTAGACAVRWAVLRPYLTQLAADINENDIDVTELHNMIFLYSKFRCNVLSIRELLHLVKFHVHIAEALIVRILKWLFLNTSTESLCDHDDTIVLEIVTFLQNLHLEHTSIICSTVLKTIVAFFMTVPYPLENTLVLLLLPANRRLLNRFWNAMERNAPITEAYSFSQISFVAHHFALDMNQVIAFLLESFSKNDIFSIVYIVVHHTEIQKQITLNVALIEIYKTLTKLTHDDVSTVFPSALWTALRHILFNEPLDDLRKVLENATIQPNRHFPEKLGKRHNFPKSYSKIESERYPNVLLPYNTLVLQVLDMQQKAAKVQEAVQLKKRQRKQNHVLVRSVLQVMTTDVLIELIGSFSSPKRLCRLSLVSKTFYTVMNSPRLWKIAFTSHGTVNVCTHGPRYEHDYKNMYKDRNLARMKLLYYNDNGRLYERTKFSVMCKVCSCSFIIRTPHMERDHLQKHAENTCRERDCGASFGSKKAMKEHSKVHSTMRKKRKLIGRK